MFDIVCCKLINLLPSLSEIMSHTVWTKLDHIEQLQTKLCNIEFLKLRFVTESKEN